VSVGRRHHLVGVLGKEPGVDGALVGLALDEGGAVVPGGEGVGGDVEAEFGLAGVFGAVAVVAVFGEDRLDMFVERNLGGNAGGGRDGAGGGRRRGVAATPGLADEQRRAGDDQREGKGIRILNMDGGARGGAVET